METRHSVEEPDKCCLNFRQFIEMAHIAPIKNNKLNPIFMAGGYVSFIDMRFEDYPDKGLARRLAGRNAQFYGKIPGEPFYLVFDGTKKEGLDTSAKPPEDKAFIALPPNWMDYALLTFTDGRMKQPKGRT